jgi:chromosome segregation ATPase
VEVVVDTNNRLPESDTGRVKLVRRWTADDKEEYVVDGKKCTKSQMASIVECLGLVYSNPYNIVQQGKIVQIAAMDDQEIYRLLE